LLVPPEDPDEIEKAIRLVLRDDDLVDLAAERNWNVAMERLDRNIVARKAIGIYERAVAQYRRLT
jgi:glycosyltransferase involved in cell wall biosynthesis